MKNNFDVLASIDTMPLGNGWFLNWGNLYFISQEEIQKRMNETWDRLDKFCGKKLKEKT